MPFRSEVQSKVRVDGRERIRSPSPTPQRRSGLSSAANGCTIVFGQTLGDKIISFLRLQAAPLSLKDDYWGTPDGQGA